MAAALTPMLLRSGLERCDHGDRLDLDEQIILN
jgi:hypothetical protein